MLEIKFGTPSHEKPKRKGPKPTTDHDSDSTHTPTYDGVTIFRRILETAAELVDDCEINANESGMNMQIMDGMQACIIDIFLSNNFFKDYRCDRPITLGIKIKDLLKILKSISFDKSYDFRMYAEEAGKFLSIDYDCDDYNLKFDLSLYVLKMQAYSIPELEFDVEVDMKTSEFLLLPKIVRNLDDNVEIKAVNKSLIFTQESDRSNANLMIKEKKGVIINVLCDMRKEISMKYVLCVAKAAGVCEDMKICMGKDTPVFVGLELGVVGSIKFFVAPKCDDKE